ncbi:MAG: YfhO family protein [Candidatus Aminicenantes bacterium]|nr:YfhO family protein [Candidatus Aminicenantes bacterium]
MLRPMEDSKNGGDRRAPGRRRDDGLLPETALPLQKLFTPADLPYLALFLAAFLFLFRGFFFQGGVLFERDGAILEIPTRQLTVQLLREGNVALWTDAHGNGQPFLANPKNAVCYPTTWLYLILPFFTAFRFHYLFHVIIGWLGLYGLHRFFRLSRPAAFLGAALFFFSGLTLSNFEFYNHIAAFAWTPWILLLAFSDSITGFKKTAALAVLWALQLLAGTPEAVVITLIFALGQMFFLPGKAGKRAVAALIALVLGTLISAVQYVPAFENLARTERSAAETSPWPLEMIQLLNVPFPDICGSDRGPGPADYWSGHLFDKGAPLYYSFYLGTAGFLLFLMGLSLRTDRARSGWKWLFLLFFLMANGRYFPLNEWLVRVPILSSIRYPVKYMMGAMFVGSLLAASFFDDYFIRKRIDGRRIRPGLIAGLGIGAAVFFLAPAISRGLGGLFVIRDVRILDSIKNSLIAGLAVLAVSLLILGAFGRMKKKMRILPALFGLLVLADPYVHNRQINPVVPEAFFDTPSILAEIGSPVTVYRQEVLPDDLRLRLGDGRKAQNFVRQGLYPFSGMNAGVRYVFNRDFFGLYPKDQRELRTASARWTEDLWLKYLRSIGCDYLVGPNPLKSLPSGIRTIEGFPVAVQKIGTDRVFPYFVRTAVVTKTYAEKWKIFATADFDPFAAAIVEKTIPGLTDSAGRDSDEAVVLRETQGRAAYRVKTAAPAIAVFRGNWAPGWKARIDGKSAPVFEVNLGLKGVFVPEGNHEVEIRYLPASFIFGAFISGLTLLALLGICVFFRARPARP